MNINNFNSVQEFEFSRKSMKKTMYYHAKALIHLKLLRIKRFSRKQNSFNRNNIKSIII